MQINSTNNISKSNQDIPTILDKYTTTVLTTSTITNIYGSFAYIDTSYTTPFSSSVNYDWDIFVTDTSVGKTYSSPLQPNSLFSGTLAPLELTTYADNSGGFYRLNLRIARFNGAITDTYTIYYVVYSTKISDSITL